MNPKAQRGSALLETVLLLPVLIVVFLRFGIATPTEAGQAVDGFQPKATGEAQRLGGAAEQQESRAHGLRTASRVIGSAARQVSKPPSGCA